MASNVEKSANDQLAAEVARRLGISESEAVRRALEAELARLTAPADAERTARLVAFLEHHVWPHVPAHVLGHPTDESERERILGYGVEGV